ncbi:MAG: hypothetical protein ABI862_04755 [Ilumatobacteraceae bacterium]
MRAATMRVQSRRVSGMFVVALTVIAGCTNTATSSRATNAVTNTTASAPAATSATVASGGPVTQTAPPRTTASIGAPTTETVPPVVTDPLPAPGTPQRITFEPGASSTEELLALTPGVPVSFVLRARAGQMLSAHVIVDGPPLSADGQPDATFGIVGPDGAALAVNARFVTRWLPAAGDYRIDITPNATLPAPDADPVTGSLQVTVVDHNPTCTSCTAPPQWTTRSSEQQRGALTITEDVPDFTDNRALDDAATTFLTGVVDHYAEGNQAGQVDIFALVLLASPTVVAIEYRIDQNYTDALHPNTDYDQFLWNPSTGEPLTRTDVFNLPADPTGAWAGPYAGPLDQRARAAIAVQLAADSTDGFPDGLPADATTTTGLVTPAVDGVWIAYARCEVLGCALVEIEVTVPYGDVPGLVTRLLQAALDGPVAADI